MDRVGTAQSSELTSAMHAAAIALHWDITGSAESAECTTDPSWHSSWTALTGPTAMRAHEEF